MATHTTPEGRRVLPLCIEGRNIIDSKTYPRKDQEAGVTMDDALSNTVPEPALEA